MKRLICIAAACASLSTAALTASAFDASSAPIAAQGTLQAVFAPWDDVEGLITDSIDGAKRQVLVQAYLLTSGKVAAALIAAKRRGVDVRVLGDAEQSAKVASSRLPELAAAGIGVWLETRYQNAHNKIILIDATTADATVITGSYNFSWTAQHKNAENVLIARKNPSLASRYALNWERHRQGATAYTK